MEMNRGVLNIKHLSKLLQKTNDNKWLRTTEHLLCVPDVKEEEWTLWLLALFELHEGKLRPNLLPSLQRT